MKSTHPLKKTSKGVPKKLRAEVSETDKPDPPAKGLKFVKGKFKGISLKTAPGVLLNPEKSFYGHKRVVFAGFCAWVLGSGDSRIGRDAIALETAKQVIAAENSRRLKNVPRYILYFMQAEPKYQPLFRTVYYPIGSLSALTRAIAGAPGQAKKRKRAEKEIRYLVAMAAILDFHTRHLMMDGISYGHPNLKKAAKLAGLILTPVGEPKKGKISSKERGHTVVAEYLKVHRRALAFLYAADRITFNDNTTLLDRLLRGSLKYKDLFFENEPTKLNEWFSYAKHFTESVLVIMPGGSGKFPSVPTGRPIAPSLREFTADQLKKIKEVLSEKAPSEKRLQF